MKMVKDNINEGVKLDSNRGDPGIDSFVKSGILYTTLRQ